jgi:histidine triad (HIT) family protein
MGDCIFCKIGKKELPSYIFHEDGDFMAILDINPVVRGHCLVIPKRHYENLEDFDPIASPGYLELIQGLAGRVKERLGADGFNIVCANGHAAQQSVDHLHFHIVPRFKGDGMDLWFHGRREFTHEEFSAIAADLRKE